MRILSREHFKRGIVVSNAISIFIGIMILQVWPTEGISQGKTSQSSTTQLNPYEPVGCFNDNNNPRALPKFIEYYRVNETDLANSFASIIHACASKVFKNGFRYFGVEYRSECWSGVNGSLTYNMYGPSNSCLWNYSVGSVWTIFVYRFVEAVNGSWSQWSSWQPCSVTCGRGHRTRARTCSNPAPKWNGMDCSGANISTESCSLHKCIGTAALSPYEAVGCFNDKYNPRALPKFIEYYRVNETDLANSFASIIHACASKVFKNGFRYFGVEYRSECWSGVNGSLTYNMYGPSNSCLSNYGVGSFWTMFVYRFVEDTTVMNPYEPVGCFNDKYNPRALPKFVKYYRVNETDLANSLASIIHACASKVFKNGFRYFGVEYRSECWTGVNGSLTYNMHGASNSCLSNYGVGSFWTIFVYRFVEAANGSWSQWSSWQPCSVTCGGGKRTRSRTCSNPAPKWNGMDCPGTNISTESCSLHKCIDKTGLHPYEPVGCFKDGILRALPVLVQTYSVNETDLANSFAAIIHKCATKVFESGFWYFGVEYRHECWSGVDGAMTYNRHGPSDNCLRNYSVGSFWTIFIYRFVEVNGSWSHWSSWQPCTVTCGEGHRTRARTCSNPAPKWNGKDCPGTNTSKESCNLYKCQDSIGSNLLKKNVTYHGQSTGESSLSLVAKIVGSFLLALLCLSGVLWFAIRYRRKSRSNSELLDPLEVLFDDIALNEIIGEGAFAKVYSGRLLRQTIKVGKGKKSSRRKTGKEQEMKMGLTVAVKMLQNGATEEQMQEFLEEIQLVKQIGYHPNILNLLAACTMTNPMFLVVEFAKNGDLLQYLRKRREQIKQAFEATGDAAAQNQNEEDISEGSLHACTSDDNRCAAIARGINNNDTDNLHDDDTLTAADLMTFAWQIAKGMEFLSRKGFVHRDLAARNVLVCEGKLVKVADFGLSRNVYAERVYHSKKTKKLPIKWMSPEAIHDQVFTTASDVWAYGILLWEILTIGGTPYPTITDHELFGALKSGYRMDKPQMCSDQMYELMRQCWEENPTERPPFTVIREQLERIMLKHCPYLDMADEYCSYAPLYDVDSDKETELESTL